MILLAIIGGVLVLDENKELPSLIDLGNKIDLAKKESLGGGERVSNSSLGAKSVSIELLAGVVCGSLVGYYVDMWLGTLPVFFIVCFFLGIAGAVRNILRKIKSADVVGGEK